MSMKHLIDSVNIANSLCYLTFDWRKEKITHLHVASINVASMFFCSQYEQKLYVIWYYII